MNTKQNKFLQDILDSIYHIENFVGTPKLYEAYNSSELIQSAVERHLEIIGEAVKNLLTLNASLNITNARKIINTRNKISHGYDEIENAEIWNIIINHLPILKTEVTGLLQK